MEDLRLREDCIQCGFWIFRPHLSSFVVTRLPQAWIIIFCILVCKFYTPLLPCRRPRQITHIVYAIVEPDTGHLAIGSCGV